jgi:hypothetical protein
LKVNLIQLLLFNVYYTPLIQSPIQKQTTLASTSLMFCITCLVVRSPRRSISGDSAWEIGPIIIDGHPVGQTDHAGTIEMVTTASLLSGGRSLGFDLSDETCPNSAFKKLASTHQNQL